MNNASIIDATIPAAQCPQNARASRSINATDEAGNEDCLFLNVYTPDDAKDLPVLVWIHVCREDPWGFSLLNLPRAVATELAMVAKI